ncbi:MAG: hypothetical protein J2P25_16505 [Nocardiopsaceae bacterium]|nr:hypothetical protein [Nocardiopsaceae bacterium]
MPVAGRAPFRSPASRQGLAFSKAVLVIAHDARLISSDPPEFRSQRGQYVRLHGVASPIWVVPTRNPEALRVALSQVPAPPVQDRLPLDTALQFTTGR